MGTTAVQHMAVELHGGCHPSGFETEPKFATGSFLAVNSAEKISPYET